MRHPASSKHPIEQTRLPPVRANDLDDIPETAKKITAKNPPLDHVWFEENHQWKPAVQAYLACIQWTDEQVGRVLDALDASPHRNDTIIVLYSDHGFHLGEKSRWTKMSLWERSTHIPFIISAPGFPQEQVCSRPSELLSIYPTLSELCGLPQNPDIEGRSVVSLLEDPKADWPHQAITTYGQNNHTVRSDRFRYIRYYDGSEELYDLQEDPNEWHNLAAGKRKPKTQKLIDELAQSLPTINALEAKPPPKKK